MFPMMGYCGINPFCYGFGFGMNPQMGFLMGLAYATAIPSTSSNPFGSSLFTNPYISKNYYNETKTTPINYVDMYTTTPSYGNIGTFGSLTASSYTYNPTYTGIGTTSLPAAMPLTAYTTSYSTGMFNTNFLAINTANNIADKLVNNINTKLASQAAQLQAVRSQAASAQTTLTGIGSIGSSQEVSFSEPQGGDLRPGLFKGRLAGQEALVTRICRKYGVSPALVASIIGLESGWGTSNLAMHNNFGGYRAAGDLGKNEKGFGYFSTIEKGLDAMIKNLAGYTRYRDVAQVNFNNLDSIGRHYCEGGVWSGKVKEMYASRVHSYIA